MSTTAVTVTTTSGVLLAANPRRIKVIFDNTSAGTIYFADVSTVTTSTGVSLATTVQFTDTPPGGNEALFYKGDYHAIAGSSLVVRVTEFSKQQ